jgi:hypothetical protein
MARKLTVSELKKIVEAEMKHADQSKKVKVKQRAWWDVDDALANQVDWLKALNIKELFAKRLQ